MTLKTEFEIKITGKMKKAYNTPMYLTELRNALSEVLFLVTSKGSITTISYDPEEGFELLAKGTLKTLGSPLTEYFAVCNALTPIISLVAVGKMTASPLFDKEEKVDVQ